MLKHKLFLPFLLFVGTVFSQAHDYSADNFFIKKKYKSRTEYTHFDDCELKDEFQDEIYAAAYDFAKEKNCTRIADFGCGSGFKLLKYFDDCETTGFEIEPTHSFLQSTYPHKKWGLSDFNQAPPQTSFDMVICSDVVEHIVNPDNLMNWINSFDFKYIVISTPDRDQIHKVWPSVYRVQSHLGPPVNIAHVREWSFKEFKKYIGKYFKIIHHAHPEREFYGQYIIAEKIKH